MKSVPGAIATGSRMHNFQTRIASERVTIVVSETQELERLNPGNYDCLNVTSGHSGRSLPDENVGWEAGTRTPIARSRVWSPTIGRPPSSESEFTELRESSQTPNSGAV